MASKSGMFLKLDARKELIKSLEESDDLAAKQAPNVLQQHSNNRRINNASNYNTSSPFKSSSNKENLSGELVRKKELGCLLCGKDNDHCNLMLCEGCNGEYHPYCLNPPLARVPQEDWFCDTCKLTVEPVEKDGLDELVGALPPSFTSRFGEICWAQGGIGFGWWPACIYDPRLTQDGARQQARKHLGKKHLVYFFECSELPFSVLSNTKISGWAEGLAENYHLGKAARSAGKPRFYRFQQALQAAMIEDGKPVELRLDWHRAVGAAPRPPIQFQQQQQLPVLPGPTLTHPQSALQSPNNDTDRRKRKRRAVVEDINNEPRQNLGDGIARSTKRRGTSIVYTGRPQAASRANADKLFEILARSKDNATKKSTESPSPPTASLALSNNDFRTSMENNRNESQQNQPFFCKILRRLSPVVGSGGDYSTPATILNIGFVMLASRLTSTFGDVRKAIMTEIAPDFLPTDMKWNFFVSSLGPVSSAQEKYLGPMFAFLEDASPETTVGKGSIRDPVTVTIIESSTVRAAVPLLG